MSETWLKAYRANKDAIWIRCKLSNNEELFYDKFEGWLSIKEKCEKENLFFNELSLQFRSNNFHIDTKDCDGIYLIRSVLGQVGSESKNYYTVGKIYGTAVKKQMVLVPELIVDKEFEQNVSECFAQAVIYNETTKNRKE